MFQSFLPGRRGQSLRGTNEIAELAARPVDKRRSCRRRNGAARGTAGERRVRSLSLPDRGDLPQRRLAGASLYFDVSGLSPLCGRSPSAYSNPTKGYCVLIGFGRMAKGVNVKAAVRMATCGAPRPPPVTSCYSTSLSPGCRPYPPTLWRLRRGRYDGLVRHLGGCRLGSVPTVLFGSSRQIGDHWRCPDRVILYRMLEAQSQGRLAKAHPDGRIMAA